MSKQTKKYIWMGVGVVIAAAVVCFAFYKSTASPYSPLPTAWTGGKLFLTLQDPVSGGLNIYTYDLGGEKLAPYLNNGKRNITPAFSPDGTKMAYASRPNGVPEYQMFVANADGTQPRQLGGDSNKFKREPVWNHAGTYIAYVVQLENPPNLNLNLPDSWVVYIADLQGHTWFVGTGMDPFFSPDDKTLYLLQNDGLNAVDLAQVLSPKKGEAVLSTLVVPPVTSTNFSSQATSTASSTPPATALYSMKISVSPDGSQLAWSAPSLGFVRLFKVSSWSPFTLAAERDIPATAYFSTFSPDGKYLALQEFTYDAGGVAQDARIVLYRLADYSSAKVLDLSKYGLQYMWLSAWR